MADMIEIRNRTYRQIYAGTLATSAEAIVPRLRTSWADAVSHGRVRPVIEPWSNPELSVFLGKASGRPSASGNVAVTSNRYDPISEPAVTMDFHGIRWVHRGTPAGECRPKWTTSGSLTVGPFHSESLQTAIGQWKLSRIGQIRFREGSTVASYVESIPVI